jgi:plastocyanin
MPKITHHHRIALLIVYLALLLLIAILWPMCPEGTIRIGLSCCHDLDENGICDAKEPIVEQPSSMIASPEPQNIIGSAQISAYILPREENKNISNNIAINLSDKEKNPINEKPALISMDYTVNIKVYEFDPKELTVPVGSNVTWINVNHNTHSVAAHYGEFRSPRLSPGMSYSFVFKNIGTYTYIDPNFPLMNGKITVVG